MIAKCTLCWTVFVHVLIILMILLLILRSLIGFNNDLWSQSQLAFTCLNKSLSHVPA